MIRLTRARKPGIGGLHHIAMLPIDYGHVTNTVPQGLRALLSANQRDGVEAPERIGSRGNHKKSLGCAPSWFNKHPAGVACCPGA
jgi:hypothetical protein